MPGFSRSVTSKKLSVCVDDEDGDDDDDDGDDGNDGDDDALSDETFVKFDGGVGAGGGAMPAGDDCNESGGCEAAKTLPILFVSI